MALRRSFTALLVSLFVIALALPIAAVADDLSGPSTASQLGAIKKKGLDLDMRSAARQLADEVASGTSLALQQETSPDPLTTVVPQVQLRGPNRQVNDPALDHRTIFPFTRPFVFHTQSEVSVAASGRNIVAAYNTSAGAEVSQIAPGVLAFTKLLLSGFSTSNDGGQTWKSGFIPPFAGDIFTFGDPVVATDRHGNFYFSGLGARVVGATFQFGIVANTSTDGGRTWSDAVFVQQDSGGDKEWLAVGPDPSERNRDNVYVTWTSFQPSGAQLRFGKSTDRGKTWTAKTIFAPGSDPDPARPQRFLQFSNVVVDPITGFIYVPFMHFSFSDVDFLRIIVSRDAGETFEFLSFGAAGASFDPTLLPVVQPGELIDCGSPGGGLRLTIHSGPNIGGGRFGLRRFVNATRLTTQPAFAARNGVLYMAWNNSTSTEFGDPNAGSNVLFMRSDDGGASWSGAEQVNLAVASDVHHVLPSLAIDADPNDVHVSYYTQHANGTVDLDVANSHDRGNTFPSGRSVRVTSTSFTLPPSNIPIPAPGLPFRTTNYDRLIVPCYALGEYQGITYANGTVYLGWGDARNTITQPTHPLDPISGQTHSEMDVLFQVLKAQ